MGIIKINGVEMLKEHFTPEIAKKLGVKYVDYSDVTLEEAKELIPDMTEEKFDKLTPKKKKSSKK